MSGAPADPHGLELHGVEWPKGQPTQIHAAAQNLSSDSYSLGQLAGQVKNVGAPSPTWTGTGADSRQAESSARAGVYQLAADPVHASALAVNEYAITLQSVQDGLRKLAKQAVELENDARNALKRQHAAEQAAAVAQQASNSARSRGDVGNGNGFQQEADFQLRAARDAREAVTTAKRDLHNLRRPARDFVDREKTANRRAAGVVHGSRVPRYSPALGIAAIARGATVAAVNLKELMVKRREALDAMVRLPNNGTWWEKLLGPRYSLGPDGQLHQVIESGVGGGEIAKAIAERASGRALSRLTPAEAEKLAARSAEVRAARLGITTAALRAAEKEAVSLAKELQEALPAATRGRVTMGTGVLKDANGNLRVVVSSSEEGARIRPAVRKVIEERGLTVVNSTGSAGHAEVKIANYAIDHNLKPVSIAAGRPICVQCDAGVIASRGAEPLSPLKVPRVPYGK